MWLPLLNATHSRDRIRAREDGQTRELLSYSTLTLTLSFPYQVLQSITGVNPRTRMGFYTF